VNDAVRRLAVAVALAAVVGATVAAARPESAHGASWCWPSSCSFGLMYGWTYSAAGGTACFYTAGEVCSGFANWRTQYYFRHHGDETAYPATILYGFETYSTIRGRFSYAFSNFVNPCLPCTVSPGQLSLPTWSRAQDTWWDDGYKSGNPAYAAEISGQASG
jgi:hypothetical protein